LIVSDDAISRGLIVRPAGPRSGGGWHHHGDGWLWLSPSAFSYKSIIAHFSEKHKRAFLFYSSSIHNHNIFGCLFHFGFVSLRPALPKRKIHPKSVLILTVMM